MEELIDKLGRLSFKELQTIEAMVDLLLTDKPSPYPEKSEYREEDIWEIARQYPRDKKWIYQDLQSLLPPDLKVKVEIMQNQLYINHQSVYDNYYNTEIIMAAPSLQHQRIIKKITMKLNQFVEENDLGEVFFSPIDVKFDDDHSFQPDIVFVAKINYDILKEKAIEGSPDLVLEVISPSNHKQEMANKKATYEKFGVSEYWIIRPKKKQVRVEVLNDKGQYELLSEVSETGTVKSQVIKGFEIDLEDFLGE